MKPLTKEILIGVWFGACNTWSEPGAIELVLLPDGTGYYDEEHNFKRENPKSVPDVKVEEK